MPVEMHPGGCLSKAKFRASRGNKISDFRFQVMHLNLKFQNSSEISDDESEISDSKCNIKLQMTYINPRFLMNWDQAAVHNAKFEILDDECEVQMLHLRFEMMNLKFKCGT